jgi:hypothetical protein
MAARWIEPELAGYQFLWASIRTGPVEVYLVDAAGGDVTNLTRQRTADSHYAAWSPDGGQVTFTSDRDGTHNLYRMDADGRNVRQLTHETAPVVAGMQSLPADGQWIYFGLFGKSEGPLMCRIRPNGGEFRVIGIGVDPRSRRMEMKLCMRGSLPMATACSRHRWTGRVSGSCRKRRTHSSACTRRGRRMAMQFSTLIAWAKRWSYSASSPTAARAGN